MFAVISLFLVATGLVFAEHDNDCVEIAYPSLCSITFGCFWNTTLNPPECKSQEYYMEGPGTCEDYVAAYGELEDTYECYPFGGNYYVYVYDPTYYDSCNADEYTNTIDSCLQSLSGATCTLVPINSTDTAGGCYELDCSRDVNDPNCYCVLNPNDPSCACYETGCTCDNLPWTTGCYNVLTNAGICENRTIPGCSAIPYCKWNSSSSSCQPDWKCYYSYVNQLPSVYLSGGACNTASASEGGYGCKSKLVSQTLYCTSDSITKDDEDCLKASADEDTCKTAGCEWIAPGQKTTGAYGGLCVQIGSGAYVARMPFVALMVILSIMLAFF